MSMGRNLFILNGKTARFVTVLNFYNDFRWPGSKRDEVL